MAIFGAGSKWDGTVEKKDTFFKKEIFLIGWDINEAEDLYSLITSIKAGDIIYLKSNKPGSLDLKIKGIGIVKDSFLNVLFDKKEDLSSRRSNFELPVRWICQNEFKITIPTNIGKLTNIRAATLYEEYLPFVQNKILEEIFKKVKF